MNPDGVQIAIEREPRLTYFGIGVYDESRKHRRDVIREFDQLRAQLLSEAGQKEVLLCIHWLRSHDVAGRNSYGLKHDVENFYDCYISNGSLIAAALGMGFEYRVKGPNIAIALGETAVRSQASS